MAWLVIGFGSDLGGDDCFGPAVAQAVSQALAERHITATVLTPRILGPELVETMRAASGVIFVDASADLAPGVVNCIDLRDQSQPGQGSDVNLDGLADSKPDDNKSHNSAIAMSHHCDPRTLVQLAETLYSKHPPAWLFVAGGSDFSLSETMSEAVARLVPEVAGKIVAILAGAQR